MSEPPTEPLPPDTGAAKDAPDAAVSLTDAELKERKPFVPSAGRGTEGGDFIRNFLGYYDTGQPDLTPKLLDPLELDYGTASCQGNRRVRGCTGAGRVSVERGCGGGPTAVPAGQYRLRVDH